MSCEPNSPVVDTTTAAAAPKLMTLKEAIDRDGVPATSSSKQRRLMDIHVTAYPGLVNQHMLPKHNTAVNDFSSIDPLQYRKAHTVRNNNTASYSEKEENVLDMLTTNQCANRMTRLGMQLREERAKNPKGMPSISSLAPRGYRSRFLSPSFDERSTCRWDYCQWEPDGFHDTVRRELLAAYRDDWTEDEKADVDISMKIPYLTMAVSSDRLKDKATIYRKDFMEDATQADYRSLSYKTNLEDLGISYAYSAYSIDDPRRKVLFDASVAALKTPHSVLEKTYSPRNSFLEKSLSTKQQPSAREELDRLRTMRREALRLSAAKRSAAESNDDGKTTKTVVIPGIKGSGYRRAPKGNDSYVCLSRDHFCYQQVDNF
ncbi:conserved hypothetical protein [Leishmania infantum JPCM5]|uniref:Uncharacterized protein n=2 Tax=Leishmania infantum TaxID=5671 RepID=A4ICG1_LEIIN|nr:conserved hypothetical protein [Leishmania infantum JPCM5]CAC9550495.1 hypothetical_protein_-_conserved [Leishmania infantum]CAM72539.1 conserved hypothetical protein [Leishmania infantum JPCM5]SUZ46642.1 hypothetical_protein_-_conserved [Leishmania infantum]|eukprot:XP_001469430.1 conserved hypothetical protein [Leishmania infantum JPCM5]